jgi:hypothetical protein
MRDGWKGLNHLASGRQVIAHGMLDAFEVCGGQLTFEMVEVSRA